MSQSVHALLAARARAACTGFWLLMMGLSAPAPAAAAKPDPHTMYAVISRMRNSGVQKIFLGEEHLLPENMVLRTVTLRATARTGPFEYWQELNFDKPTDARNVMLWIQNRIKNDALKNVFVFADWGAANPLAERLMLEAVLSNRNITLEGIFFEDGRRDMLRFIESPEFAIADMGFGHVENELIDPSHVRLWSGLTDSLTSKYVRYTLDTKEAMFSGLVQARSRGVPAVAMRPGYIVDGATGAWYPRRETYAGANLRGFAVLELPVGDYNMTMFFDHSLMPLFEPFTGYVWGGKMFCKWLNAPCSERHVHDEL